MNIRCTYWSKSRVTTNSKHHLPIAENLLAQRFYATELSQVWVSDITYVIHLSAWVYLTIVMDLADRQIIGWALSADLSAASTVMAAFKMATGNRPPQKDMIIHADRGSQYACEEFRERLNDLTIRQGMSRKGNCWDNAVAESFFKSFKAE